ncbi:hypothetical protein PTKIN_Ptkin09bG0042400 [Pterospermum kingtungense]
MKLDGTAEIFIVKYGNIARLLSIRVDRELLKVAFEFWDPSFRCFKSRGWDLAPTLEEYSFLLGLPLLKTKSDLPLKLFMKASPLEPRAYLAKLLRLDMDTLRAINSKKEIQRLRKRTQAQFSGISKTSLETQNQN